MDIKTIMQLFNKNFTWKSESEVEAIIAVCKQPDVVKSIVSNAINKLKSE